MKKLFSLFTALTLMCSSGAWATAYRGAVSIDLLYTTYQSGDSIALSSQLVNSDESKYRPQYAVSDPVIDSYFGVDMDYTQPFSDFISDAAHSLYRLLNPNAAVEEYFVVSGITNTWAGGPWIQPLISGRLSGFYTQAEMADSLVALNNSMTYPLDDVTITNYVNTLKQTSASSAREIFEEYCQNIRNHDAEQKRLLAEAKEAAIAEINTALGDITDATLLATIQGYKDQINAATVIEAINPIKVDALKAIADYKVEQERLRRLAEAKEAAIAEINTALGDITDATLLATIQGYKDQINAATVIEAINPIKVDALKAIADYKAEQERLRLLAEAKEAAIASIQALVSGSTDELVISTADKYIALIEAATVIEDVTRLRSEAENLIGRLLTEPNAFEFGFIGKGNPTETQHALEGVKMTYSADGEDMTVTINGAEVTYPLSQVSELTYFQGTPAVALKANPDPQHADEYYTTFYSGLEAYTIPAGVTAYTASLAVYDTETWLNLNEISGVLPQGEAVLLKSNNSSITMETAYPVLASGANALSGVDIATPTTALSGTIYTLAGKDGEMAFYQYAGLTMPANKAYLGLPASVPAPRRITFGSHVVTDLNNANVNANVNKFILNGQFVIVKDGKMYNAQGAIINIQ